MKVPIWKKIEVYFVTVQKKFKDSKNGLQEYLKVPKFQNVNVYII